MMHACRRHKRSSQRSCTTGCSIRLACTDHNEVDLGLLKTILLWEPIRVGMLFPLPCVMDIEIESGNELLEPGLISLADMFNLWYARASKRGLRQTRSVKIPSNDQLRTPWCASNGGVEGAPHFFTLAPEESPHTYW